MSEVEITEAVRGTRHPILPEIPFNRAFNYGPFRFRAEHPG